MATTGVETPDRAATGGPADLGSAETRRSSGDEETRTASASIRTRTADGSAPRGRLWKAAVAAGVLALLAAVAVVIPAATGTTWPRLRPETVRSLRQFALLLAAFVGIFGLYVAYHRDVGDGPADPGSESIELPASNPERAQGPTRDAVGDRLDDQLERIGGLVDDADGKAYTAYKIRRSLRGLTVRVVSSAADCSTERAREHVDRGTWTDDVRAAAFVGGDSAPSRPLTVRVRDWASGDAFDRQVTATVEELAALAGVDDR